MYAGTVWTLVKNVLTVLAMIHGMTAHKMEGSVHFKISLGEFGMQTICFIIKSSDTTYNLHSDNLIVVVATNK